LASSILKDVAMRTMSAKDAKNHFGELLMEAQKGPVTIEKNGKPAAVVISWDDHEHMERIKLERLRAMIAEGIADADAGRVREWDDELMAEICPSDRAADR
jgi:prevent-host-death family protein